MSILTENLSNGIFKITLNRADKLNTLNADVIAELTEQFNQVKNDPAVHSLLITGIGKAFCAGADIKELAQTDATTGYAFARSGQACFTLLENLGKPSIAAINGFAFGGGCELAMSTSLRIASDTAKFGQPEVRLGVIPGYGGTQRLSRLIGKGRAIDLCITGRTIDAATALSWGLTSEVTPLENCVPRAIEILSGLNELGPLAIQATLEVIHRGFDMPLSEALHYEALHFARVCASEDSKEGANAFLEKRPAIFSGK